MNEITENDIRITENDIRTFEQNLRANEKSEATVEKYSSALRRLMAWLDGGSVSREQLVAFRNDLLKTLSAGTVNGILSAVNTWLNYNDMCNCRVKLLKLQRRVFCSAKKELSKEEYNRLVAVAKRSGTPWLALVMETICATGIRVSELKYITVEALTGEVMEISLKGKTRMVLIPKKLRRKLKKYAQKKKIRSGEIFLGKNGKPLSRKLIWAEMKKLCVAAHVDASKVFPHNLRHLFARCFYKETKDITKLADVLGHSSIETTRIYLKTSGEEHIRILDKLCLVS